MGLLDSKKQGGSRGGDQDDARSDGPIVISSRFLDRVLIKDPDMIDYLGDEHVRPPSKSVSAHWMPLHELWRLQEQLNSWKWDDGKMPQWLSDAFQEGRWARKERWNQNSIAWYVDDTAVIQAPYTLTLADSLRPPNMTTPARYSKPLDGWVLQGVLQNAESLLEVMDTYDIQPSALLSTNLEGRGAWMQTLEETVQAAEDEGYSLPGPFASGREYKDHQRSAVLALARNGGGMLADQVGLGKGGEFIGGLLSLDEYIKQAKNDPEGAFPVVVSVTRSMKTEIVEEILKWKDDARIEILEGRSSSPLEPNIEFYVLNHDILKDRLEDLMEMAPVAFIADESHVFKNPDAKRTEAAQALADEIRGTTNSPYVTLASGTPFLNSPIELWSILGILGKQDEFGEYARSKVGMDRVKVRTRSGWRRVPLTDKRAFEIRWCDGHYDQYKNWHNWGASNTAELNRLLISHGMIRRRKSDVIHPLPPLSEQFVFIEPEPWQMDEYRQVEEEFKRWLIDKVRREAEIEGEDPRVIVKETLKKLVAAGDVMQLTQLRQEAARIKVDGTVRWVSRFLDGEQEVTHLDGSVSPVRDDPTRRKLILFAHHREPRKLILEHPELERFGMVHILPGGDQSQESIQESKRMFQKDDDARLMVCSMAAREGHTLTAAKDVYLHEMPFVPSWVIQMAGRAWARFSEEYEPHEAWVHYAVARGTIDAALVRKNKIKKSMFNSVIDGEGQDDAVNDLMDTNPDTLLEALSIGKKELGIAT